MTTPALGRYELLELLGRGGMAEVWRARMLGPAGYERQIAVKRILPGFGEDAEFVALFLREATISARFSHGNIVQVYELGEADGTYFLTMEYVHGQNLGALLRALSHRGLGPPVGLAAYVGREVCRALDYVHGLTDEQGRSLGLLHRDVSPSNVMLAYDGTVKLVDFGIARAMALVAQRFTQARDLRGKLEYMAPERIEAGTVDHRADQFSAGVVVHEMLTGRRLFKGASDVEVVRSIRGGAVPPPSADNEAVDAELDRACLRALANDPAGRFPSCAAFGAALDAAAHAHRFGPTQLAALLAEVLPPRREPRAPAAPTLLTLSPVRAPVIPPVSLASTGAARPHRRWPLIVVGIAALGLGVGIGAGSSRRHGRSPVAPPVTAPPSAPTSLPPVPSPIVAAPAAPSDEPERPPLLDPMTGDNALAPPRSGPSRRTRPSSRVFFPPPTSSTPTPGRMPASRSRAPQRDLKSGADVVDPFE
jgi:eukaryotic-like serine/threonine-protein kinase